MRKPTPNKMKSGGEQYKQQYNMHIKNMQDRSTGIGVIKSILKRPSGVNSNRLGIKFVLPNSAAATVQEECDETSETQSTTAPPRKRPASAKEMEANRMLACKMEDEKIKEQEKSSTFRLER